ncbi:protein-ADP-ribose hydrolase [Clostridium sp.]|jgi:O-acetyl-ADP-ribose deacetylase (regulator of RNase III)|uniref:protein-ADP-ribose hydrolase n=1 Tax=Clostridium sp. TaxID=1506 RepID=UPI0039F45666
MNQDERRLYLLRALLHENIKYRDMAIPDDITEQRNLLRSLFNVRMPWPVSEEFLRIQDEYLTERNIERGIVDAQTLTPVASNDRIYIWQGDITTLKIDAITNAANSQMLGCFQPCHPCIDNFIHTYSGVQLRLKCNEIMKAQGHEEETGKAKITPGYNLPCKYILHTVGPIIHWKVTQKHCDQLASCYRNCLQLAVENGVESVAFCCISTGVFRFPQRLAAEIAVKTVEDFLNENHSMKQVVFNVFKDEDLQIYQSLLNDKIKF